MGSHSKQKGSAYERVVCQRLSMWVSDLTRKDIFWRSAMSGGRATVASKKVRSPLHRTQAGDLSAIHPMGHKLIDIFVIDCKFYKDLELDGLAFNNVPPILREWRKLCSQCRGYKSAPLMVTKQNFKDDIVFTSQWGYNLLYAARRGSGFKVWAVYPGHDIIIIPLRDILTGVSYANLTKKNVDEPSSRRRFKEDLPPIVVHRGLAPHV